MAVKMQSYGLSEAADKNNAFVAIEYVNVLVYRGVY